MMLNEERIKMLHGSGGKATGELIESVFAEAYGSDILAKMEDAAVVEGSDRIAITTDSFVITPLDFPGGDIGRLSVCGTVNDLLMRGAVPKYITCGWIIEEGTKIEDLKAYAASMRDCAKEAGVQIVAGDTKVIEGRGGVMINTSGVGMIPEGSDISAANARVVDAIILSGNLGDHHAAILSSRMGIETDIVSDAAPLCKMVDALREKNVHVLRDVTRGGLSTVLCELAAASKCGIVIKEEQLPVSKSVRDLCGILGLDPLYMGNEGKLVAFVDPAYAKEALKAVREAPYGENAAIIGYVSDSVGELSLRDGEVVMETPIGGIRRLDVLMGEGLPRIC